MKTPMPQTGNTHAIKRGEKGKPVVIIPASNHVHDKHRFAVLGRNYAEAVRLAGCLPLMAPAEPADLHEYLGIADGVLLTGGVANVDPAHYGETVRNPALPLDPERDALTLPLIREAVARGVPILGICRGFQEMNVALGGSLHQAVQEVPGMNDHRSHSPYPEASHYAPAHTVVPVPGGVLTRVNGPEDFRVNSCHGQGVNRLAACLRIEALAPDGLIEAFSGADSPGFCLAVQWHPEWKAGDNPDSTRIFNAFGDACRAYRAGRDNAR